MIELAEQVKMIEPGVLERLPRGVIVGSAIVEKCICTGEQEARPYYAWQLGKVQRLQRPRKPRGRPQPVWFGA